MRYSAVKYGALSILAVLLMCSGCRISAHGHNNFHGSGRLTTQTRSVPGCDGITLRHSGNVYLMQSDDESIRIEADDNLMGRVLAERQHGTLVVGLRDGEYSDVTLKIYVSMKNIDRISIEGAGTIECSNRIETEALDCTVNGAGNIELRGSSRELRCAINGAGNISGKQFTSKDVTATLNGAGNCTVYAADRIDATLNGVGAITYYGDPEDVKTDIAGIGFISRGD